MAIRTGKVILAKNIKMDKDYTNVLSYSENDILSLVQTNAVANLTDASFTRQDGNEIDVSTPYGTALQANYVAFQNPDYSNKWFFAFIDEVKYISNGTTRIIFTIDEYSTWNSYWTKKNCFVIREHTLSDVIGNNLVPENVETGEYVSNGNSAVGMGGKFYVATTSYLPDGDVVLGTNCGGVPMAGGIVGALYWQQLAYALQELSNDGHMDEVQQVFMIPLELVDFNDWERHGSSDSDNNTWWEFNGRTTPVVKTTTVSSLNSLNGYTPRNKKLLTGQFCYGLLDNMNGTVNKIEFEYFSDRNNIQIQARGVISVGSSVTVYPLNYKGQTYNYLEGIMQGKYPTLSWSGDAFTNWLTQNSVNLSIGMLGVGAQLGMAGINPMGAVSGASTVINTMAGIYQHSICPQSVRGNTNGGDVLTANNLNQTFFQQMSITYEFASRIDQYFDRYGYATNKLKSPNISGRPNWNYIKISSDDCIGYSTGSISVPPKSMETINNIFRNGVTIWHNHANLGDYTVNNQLS